MTGANQGIGFEIGRQLGKLGFAVILAARDEAKVNAAADRLRGEGLDVTGPSTAEEAARWLDGRSGRLDVLVNNAGIGPEFATGTKPSGLGLAMLGETYETNVFGAFTVIRAWLPLLRESSSARIINQPSTLGSLGTLSDTDSPCHGNNTLACNSSKSALNGLTPAFAKDLAGDRVSVNSDLPRLGQDRHGVGCRPTLGRAGCGRRREAGDDGFAAHRQVPR